MKDEACEPLGVGSAGRGPAGQSLKPGTRSSAQSPEPVLLRVPQVVQDGLERVDDLLARRPGFCKAQFQVERLGRRTVSKHVVLRATRLRPRRLVAKLLTREAALAGN